MIRILSLIGLAALLVYLPADDVRAARAKDKLPTGIADPLELPAANPIVERVQRALNKSGYYHGPIDGRFSPATDEAIRTYQRRESLPRNGIASKELAVHIETSSKVQSLLKQLQSQRLLKMKKARKALLENPETRGLVTDPDKRKRKTRIGRNRGPCFRNPTPLCLLEEASESAIAVHKTELRDWVLGEILVAQAKAGLVEQAMDTARRIGDPRLIMVALRDIAEAQAAAGRPVEALSAADIIPDPQKRLEALASIARIQVARKDFDGAARTAGFLLAGIEEVDAPLKRISLAAKAVTVLARSGHDQQAEKKLLEIRTLAETKMAPAERSAALRHIASAYADAGKPKAALSILKDLPDTSEHIPVLVSAATAQARAGDATQAITTAESIEAVRYRAIVLSRIASAQAKAGNVDGARATLEKAIQAAAKIKKKFAQAFAYERIVLTLLELSRSGHPAVYPQALETAVLISDDKLRAHALWSLAMAQEQAGDTAGANKAKDMAETATRAVKSPFTRVWMFSELTLELARAERPVPAWDKFNRAITIAEAITNAWGRSRALARLASILIELTELTNNDDRSIGGH